MLWVGGNIVIYGLYEFGIDWFYELIKYLVVNVVVVFENVVGFVKWFVIVVLDGVFGLIWGMILILIVIWVLVFVVVKLCG